MENKTKLCYAKQISSDSRPGDPIPWRLTTREIDRDGEVVEPSGVILDNYVKNPVVLWAHGFEMERRPPIGRILPETIVKTTDYLDADVVFDINDPFARLIESKIRSGFINCGSIGFRPHLVDTNRTDKLPGQQGVTHKEWELLEFSIVPVPANPNATRKEYEDFINEANQAAGGIVIDKDQYFEQFKSYFPTKQAKMKEWLKEANIINQTEIIDITKPYPNEHSARLEDPNKYVRFRRQNNKFGDGIHAIWGITEDGKAELQAIRFDKDKFTVAEAKKWLKDHDYKPILFEPAAEEEKNTKIGAVLNVYNRQIIENAIQQLDELKSALEEMLAMSTQDNERQYATSLSASKITELQVVEEWLQSRRLQSLDKAVTEMRQCIDQLKMI